MTQSQSSRDLAAECLQTARRHLRAAEYDECLVLALSATQLDPDNPHGFRLVGNLCLQLGYVEETKHRHEVRYRCQDSLARLLRSVPGVARIAPSHVDPSDYDACIPLLSLPAMIALTPETVPRQVPYVSVDEPTASRWRQVLDRYQRWLKVGVVWQGNSRQGDDERRSVPLEALAPLASVENVRLFSLQKGLAGLQIREVSFGSKIVDLTPDVNDFADTAAIVQQLDLIVCVDTAVAHVAGALGRRVWILLSYGAGALWMLDRSDTPFYPTALLFRQPAPGAWELAIRQ